MEEWIKMIGNVGFPIVVTLYLLHRIESKLDGVIVAIEKLPRQLLKYDDTRDKKKVCSRRANFIFMSGITTIDNDSLSSYTFRFSLAKTSHNQQSLVLVISVFVGQVDK